jgi:hypothetical protein
MTRTLCLVALTLMCWPVLAHAQGAVVVDDAYVSTRAGLANRSFGGAETLLVSPIERTFLRFSLTLPDGTPGAHVAQATLKVFVRDVERPGEIGVYRVSGAWSEGTVTGNVTPAIGALEGAPVAVGNDTEQGWVTLDVTQAVRDWLNNEAVNDGFALVGAGATSVTFDSKENGGTSHEPVLEIRLGHAATAADAARLGGIEPAGYVRADDVRLTDDRGPRPGSPHYVQNTTDPQDARFNVAHGLVRGDLTVLGTLHANVGGNFIHNRTDPQPNASFNIAGTGTVGGTLTGGVVNAATQFTIGGQRALSLGPAGLANVFVGADAGTATFGSLNTFVGSRAGMRTTVGGLNVLIGADAGANNTEGGQNTFLGAFAGSSNTTACCGTFVGNFAGSSNTTGFANVFVGGGAGGRNTEGGRNVFVGDLAGNDLDFPGFESGTNTGNETGWFNTFVGSRSGIGVTTGSNNTFVGFRTAGASNLQFATAIGAGASVTTDNTIVLGRSVDTVVVPGALSLNIVDANTQFNLAGLRVLGADSLLNVSLGYQAGLGTGGANTSLGFQAGQAVTGRANVLVGNRSGRFTAGSSNTFVGSIAGEVHASGDDNTFVGDGAGASITGGSENSFYGVDAGGGRAGGAPNRNSFFGTLAGRNSHTDFDNAFFGYRAGFANEAGISNAFFGAYAGENTTSSFNAFFGTAAGRQNTSGNHNAFFGIAAGTANTLGGLNVFVGANAGGSNVTGGLNTFVGGSAGLNNQGSHNSFFGTNAGRQNISGNHNSFFGRAAGFSSTADRNAFFGAGAGELTTTGSDNAFFGTSAGHTNVSGTLNTLLGAEASLGADNLTNATAIGARTVVGASNSLVLGNNVNVGIGTSVPGSKLTVAGVIETTTGGVRFPDGTTQLTAATGGLITDITAGLGLIGGGAAGNLSMDVGAGPGISVGPDAIAIADLGVSTAQLAEGAVTSGKIAAGQVVKTLNGLTDQVILAAGGNISITPAGNTLTIAATGGGGGLSAPGLLNLFGGPGAGANTTPSVPFPFSGNRNTFVGNNAGAANSQGAWNTFVGAVAGEGNTTGMHNTVVGAEAGQSNAAGDSNSFFGSSAGRLTTGFRNAFFGAAAGEYTVGSDNTFVGSGSGTNSTNAFNNAFLGSLAGGDNTTGSRNVFLGRMAGLFNTIGGDNTFVGYRAGDSVTSTTGNTAVGANADVATGISNATAIGANAVANQSNSLVLGNNVDVGIGSSTPQARLDVRGGHILVGSAGQGVILKSPDGGTCRLLTIANGTGDLTLTAVPCPM